LIPDDGTSASVGEGPRFGLALDTGGGDLVKKLKSELCFAISNLTQMFFYLLFFCSSPLALASSRSVSARCCSRESGSVVDTLGA